MFTAAHLPLIEAVYVGGKCRAEAIAYRAESFGIANWIIRPYEMLDMCECLVFIGRHRRRSRGRRNIKPMTDPKRIGNGWERKLKISLVSPGMKMNQKPSLNDYVVITRMKYISEMI